MSKNLEIKKQVVSDIVKKFQDAQSVIVVSFSGLSVEAVTALRAQFRQNNVEYCVLKNTLVRRALHELNIEGLDDVLNGPSAFAFGMSDPVSPAKIVNDFITKNKTEALQIKAGLMGTEILSDAQIKELATVPSREVLLARLLGSLQSSIAGFVRVLDAIAKKNSEETAAAPEA
ncbi:MAG: 50S ribosomal protein L10 [Candidatus Limiplasma sp.]|nr:50S ribosomal protein L10 [Candidatus Limiplasma sp.]MDY4062372.1 50S ribosomal protein L10 [Candidatus Limiplasma sp.]